MIVTRVSLGEEREIVTRRSLGGERVIDRRREAVIVRKAGA